MTSKKEQQLARFWQRHATTKRRVDSLIEAKGGLQGEHDKNTALGQLQIALNVLALCRVNLALNDLPGAYDSLCRAESIHDNVLKLHVNPEMVAANETREQRHDGGSERGHQQRSAKQAEVDRCQSIANEIWGAATDHKQRFAYKFKSGLAPKIREEYRREQYRRNESSEPPPADWIQKNISHPRKNSSS